MRCSLNLFYKSAAHAYFCILSTKDCIHANEGKIIGYGSAYITESHTGSMKDLELPIVYYEKTDKPPTSKYTLVISTATSYLGDYLTGCDANKLWVDDFEWVY